MTHADKAERNEDGFNQNGLLEGEVELWRNAQWRVTNVAIEDISSRSSCPYWIGLSQIHQAHWPDHMSEKTWVDINLFNEAIAMARGLFPKEQAA